MKKIMIVTVVMCSALLSKAAERNTDSAQVPLKEKLELVEKLVKQLQAEVKTLQVADSSLTAEIAAIRQTTIATPPKKVVIDRRGSKQASFQ